MFKNFRVHIENLDKKLEKDLINVSDEIAQIYLDTLKQNIYSNKYGFVLKDTTIANRIYRGITSTTPLVDTEEYIKSIIKKGTLVTVTKGMHKGGISYEELSYILEYGRFDKSVPAFPVWSKTFQELKPTIRGLIKDFAKRNNLKLTIKVK